MTELRFIPMTAALVVALGWFSYVMVGKTRLVLMAVQRPEFFAGIPERVRNLFVFGIGQKKMFKDPGAGLMHAFIFWGFLVLQLRTFYLVVLAFVPDAHIPLVHSEYAFAKDITELVVLAMCGYGFYRRLITKPARLTLSGEALLVLGMISMLLMSDLLYDGMHFALMSARGAVDAVLADEIAHAPVGALLAGLFTGLDESTLSTGREVFYWWHIFIVLTFLNMLPGSKHFHVITALPNTLFADIRPKGALRPILDIEEQETFGVGKVLEFDMRQILDTYTCTECGRCEVNCPTTITGKTLSPKRLITDIRDHLYGREEEFLTQGGEDEAYDGPTLIDDVKFAAIWDCTTCRACSEACPAMIEHVDKIVDMRRYMTLMEGNFPKELGVTLRNLEQKGNPWGLPSGDRTAWAEHLAIPTVHDEPDADVIFWVGCAGAYDDQQKKVSQALVRILREAGVSFAILGEDETCSGDPARRAGNEYLFQIMAEKNIATLRAAGAHKKKIVTHCPHCFNTLANEYPDFGGVFEVTHHSTLIEELIADGRITPRRTPEGTSRVVYHDSCYLGRYNDVYEEPRRAITAIPGIQLQEMTRNRSEGMCCGAGGARVWMEEHDGKRINQERVEQAMETKPDTIAVACPFCKMMLKDGVNELQIEGIRTVDIAELVAESLGPEDAPTEGA
jgi:Fe-S oxidoreductase